MNKYPKNKADRWSSADPATVTALAKHSIDADLAAITDFFVHMRHIYPSMFRGWSLTQFKNWNDERILALADPEPVASDGLKMLANRILMSRVMRAQGFPDDVMHQLTQLKNALIEDLQGQPDEVVAPALADEFDRFIANQTPRQGLTRSAKLHLAEVQSRVKQ